MADMATIATRLPWLSAAEGADRVDGAMRPLALHLLRRAALYALLAASLLLIVPRVLMELGVLGEEAGAVEAQRAALVAQQEQHRRAEAIVDDVDKRLNSLEESYTVMTTGLDKATVAPLFSLMKTARAAGGGLTLAYEQGDYAKVLRDEQTAIEVIESTRNTIHSAKR